MALAVRVLGRVLGVLGSFVKDLESGGMEIVLVPSCSFQFTSFLGNGSLFWSHAQMNLNVSGPYAAGRTRTAHPQLIVPWGEPDRAGANPLTDLFGTVACHSRSWTLLELILVNMQKLKTIRVFLVSQQSPSLLTLRCGQEGEFAPEPKPTTVMPER